MPELRHCICALPCVYVQHVPALHCSSVLHGPWLSLRCANTVERLRTRACAINAHCAVPCPATCAGC
eukprot:15468076-Alexandrium_andersonii.AAC.1